MQARIKSLEEANVSTLCPAVRNTCSLERARSGSADACAIRLYIGGKVAGILDAQCPVRPALLRRNELNRQIMSLVHKVTQL